MQIVYQYDKEDIELLKQAKDLPENPCNACRDSFACCGCSTETEYQQKIAPYKERNVLSTAVQINCFVKSSRNIRESLIELGELYESIKASMPKESFEQLGLEDFLLGVKNLSEEGNDELHNLNLFT